VIDITIGMLVITTHTTYVGFITCVGPTYTHIHWTGYIDDSIFIYSHGFLQDAAEIGQWELVQ
jgi:hypothetical protein